MKEIPLQTVNPEAFTMVLKYLYTKDLDIVGLNSPIELLIDTLSLAHEYDVEPLERKLEYLVSLKITVENVCSLLEFAHSYQLYTVTSTLFHCAFLVTSQFLTTTT